MKRKGSERYRQLGKIEARSNEELAKPPISENSYDRVGRKEDYKLNCDLISRRSLVAGAAALAANGALFSLGAARENLPWLQVNGNRIEDLLGNPIVLRGVALIDLPLYALRSANATTVNTVIDRVTMPVAGGTWGTRVIRFAIYPDNHTGPGSSPYKPIRPWPFDARPGGGNDQYFASIVKPAVDYATSKGLYVIVDYHDINSTTAVYPGRSTSRAQMCGDFWRYMAPKFANYSNVIYEVFNEPIDDDAGAPASCWASLKSTMQNLVNTIRGSAPNNLVLVVSPLWCQATAAAADDPLVGANLIYTTHLYAPNYINLQSDIVRAAHQVPVFLTEWGDPSDINYLSSMRSMAEANGISNTAWAVDYAWWPPLFDSNWKPNYYGRFVQQWLNEMRDRDQPQR